MNSKQKQNERTESSGKSHSAEKHPLGFFLPEHARILMLGSFPPPENRWSVRFYYPNYQNDMWRIIGFLFFNDKNHFADTAAKAFREEQLRNFCIEKGIALGDTAEEIIRLKGNASDQFLQVITPWNPEQVLNRIPECHTVIITGQKAFETFRSVIPVEEPAIGSSAEFRAAGRILRLYRMPSSSRAYPKPVEDKARYYRLPFTAAGILPE